MTERTIDMGYTLKLDLTPYQLAVLRTNLDIERQRAIRDGRQDTPYPFACQEISEMIDGYMDATEAAKRLAALTERMMAPEAK